MWPKLAFKTNYARFSGLTFIICSLIFNCFSLIFMKLSLNFHDIFIDFHDIFKELSRLQRFDLYRIEPGAEDVVWGGSWQISFLKGLLRTTRYHNSWRPKIEKPMFFIFFHEQVWSRVVRSNPFKNEICRLPPQTTFSAPGLIR